MPLMPPDVPQNQSHGWHNFATGQTDWRDSIPATDEEAKQYLPQDPAALNLYDLYRLRGDSIEDAFIATLRALTGQGASRNANDPPPPK
jgi:hypothetical protein